VNIVVYSYHFSGINTKLKAVGIVYELNSLICSRFNRDCQLFKINIASVFILVNFNTIYDGKRFLNSPIFCTVVTEQLKLS
jgi:hypothetical protein